MATNTPQLVLALLSTAGFGLVAGYATLPTQHVNPKGSCYDMVSHSVTCGMAKDDCSGSWYEPGYVSSRDNCCHCKASCENPSADCTYHDAPKAATSAGSCYDSSTHEVTCNVEEVACSGYYYEPGYVSSRDNCCHCKASCENPSDDCTYHDAPKAHGVSDATSAGSCYDSSTHEVTCNVEEVACSGYYYAPGYVSSSSGCCHCMASCDFDAETAHDCSYYDGDTRSHDGCYDPTTHAVTCEFAGETTESECTTVWSEDSASCQRRLEHGGCDVEGKTLCVFKGETSFGNCDGTWTDEHATCTYKKENPYAGCYLGAPTHAIECLSDGATEAACSGTWVKDGYEGYCGHPKAGTVPTCSDTGAGCYWIDNNGRSGGHFCSCIGDYDRDGLFPEITEETCTGGGGKGGTWLESGCTSCKC